MRKHPFLRSLIIRLLYWYYLAHEWRGKRVRQIIKISQDCIENLLRPVTCRVESFEDRHRRQMINTAFLRECELPGSWDPDISLRQNCYRLGVGARIAFALLDQGTLMLDLCALRLANSTCGAMNQALNHFATSGFTNIARRRTRIGAMAMLLKASDETLVICKLVICLSSDPDEIDERIGDFVELHQIKASKLGTARALKWARRKARGYLWDRFTKIFGFLSAVTSALHVLWKYLHGK